MRKPLLRIPYTDILPPGAAIPSGATTIPAAVAALQRFLAGPSSSSSSSSASDGGPRNPGTGGVVVLTGAGLSVASGLADYRGERGTYRVNRSYRPTYYTEFLASHESRKRYWARSFLGWPTLAGARPNAAHWAVRDLGPPASGHDGPGGLGVVSAVVTQNVDSFHRMAHPSLPTVELHGYLRAVVCTTCHSELDRHLFQRELARLNPAWADFLAEAIAAGAFEPDANDAGNSSSNDNRGGGGVGRGIRTNPDGDVDVPGAPYATFRYPPCPTCLARSVARGGSAGGGHDAHVSTPTAHEVRVDADGAWQPPSSLAGGDSTTLSATSFSASQPPLLPPAGVLKPAVVMFGESIPPSVRASAEAAVDSAGRLLVLGTSLATYSAWRLARRAQDRGVPLAVVNLGGVRGEDALFAGLREEAGARGGGGDGALGVRVELDTEALLPALVEALRRDGVPDGVAVAVSALPSGGVAVAAATTRVESGAAAFKDLLS